MSHGLSGNGKTILPRGVTVFKEQTSLTRHAAMKVGANTLRLSGKFIATLVLFTKRGEGVFRRGRKNHEGPLALPENRVGGYVMIKPSCLVKAP